MKKSGLTIIMMIISLIFIVNTNTYSQDWPQWRGINRDGKVTGFKAPATYPAALSQLWKVTVGFGDASPVMVKDKIYLISRQGNEEVILCLDAATGKEVWKNSYPAAAVTGPSASAHPGPRSTPAVANGKIVTFGVTGILSCIDAATGKLIWRKENPTNAIPTFYTGTSPFIIDGLCIVHVGKMNDGQLLALDLNTGNEKWKWQGDGPAYASPSLMNIDGKKHLIAQTEKNLIALDLADGKLIWQLATTAVSRFYNATSPYIDGQTIYLTGQGSGMKAIKVEKQGDQYVPKELWSKPAVGAKWNTPILKDGYLYGYSDTRRIYCLKAATGDTTWVDRNTNSDFATILDCGPVIIGLSSTNNLVILKPVNTAYSEIAKYKVSETTIYASPIISVSDIYVKDTESLIKYNIK